jgi:AcrR family transcriptional regulator
VAQPSPKLSPARIVDAAVEMADAEGLDQVSTRSLATRLDVTPMALYRHVRDKDEIVAAVVDVLLARHGVDPESGIDWRDHLLRIATSLRAVLAEHPEALRLFTRRPVTTPVARARLAGSIAVLVAAGFDEADATRAYAAVHTYTIGFSALEAGRRGGATDQPGEPVEPGEPDDQVDAIIRGFVTDDQFHHGLAALIAGLAPGAPAPVSP